MNQKNNLDGLKNVIIAIIFNVVIILISIMYYHLGKSVAYEEMHNTNYELVNQK